MNQEQSTISYDEFFPKSLQERLSIFNEISAENRALLVKTHAERWLAANRSRLSNEQIAIVEEIIRSITLEWYKKESIFEKIEQQVEALRQKAEAVLTLEDVKQLMSNRAEYIPVAEDKNN